MDILLSHQHQPPLDSRLCLGVSASSPDAHCAPMASRGVPRSSSNCSWVRKARPSPTSSSTTSSPCTREEGTEWAVGHPRGTCGYGQGHSGRAQGTAGLVLGESMGTYNIFVPVLGQILSCEIRSIADTALFGLGFNKRG